MVVDQFVEPMQFQPSLFWVTEDQNQYILCSKKDGWHYNATSRRFMDIDLLYSIDCIKEIGHDCEEKCFYILANRHNDRYGIFLIRFKEDEPQNYSFIMKIGNSLEIEDCDIQIFTSHQSHSEDDGGHGKSLKELIVSYKSIYVNNFTIFVMDMTTSEHLTIFKHISPQQWESKIYGMFLRKNMEYVTMNKDGIHVISLSNR